MWRGLETRQYKCFNAPNYVIIHLHSSVCTHVIVWIFVEYVEHVASFWAGR